MAEAVEEVQESSRSNSRYSNKAPSKWSGWVPSYNTKKTDTMLRGIAKRSDKKKKLEDYSTPERSYHVLDTATKGFWDSLLGIKRRRKYARNIRVQQPVDKKKRR